MGSLSKLEILGAQSKYDVSNSTFSNNSNALNNMESLPPGCCKLLLPNGGYINVLKVLFSNKCIHDCRYCFNSTQSLQKKICFESQELANLFMNLYMRKSVKGLFLSSAVVKNAEKTMEQMIETVEILRSTKYSFKGYIHLKVLPGAPYDLVKRGAVVADRMSVNLEAPSKSRFSELTSTKNYKSDILTRLRWLSELKVENGFIRSGHTTQFVVGASNESDKELLKTSDLLYNKFNLNRAYYSAFEPIRDTALENHPPTPSIRQHRLYQTDWLLRIYNYNFKEIELAFGDDENLPLTKDPKILIARQNKDLYPLEINEASYEELLRVPGIGPNTAKKIVTYRKSSKKFKKLIQLKKTGVILKRALPFIKIQGKFQKNLKHFINMNTRF
ncbi:MAG: helix-hairpin-helix domain-containing protein [Candidatus Helarchaeota archaeon]|nr:helix-hairpin-helix domain-containing protein [Candidatus Helarchaeota archaeon]